MKEKIKQTVGRLKGNYWGLLCAISLEVIIKLCGFTRMDAPVADEKITYIMQNVGILLTLLFIPLSLRLFQFSGVKKIKEKNLEEAIRSYRFWNHIRLSMLALPMIVNVAFYHCISNNTFLFCAAMAFIATFFCIPSESRMKNELDLPEDINE